MNFGRLIKKKADSVTKCSMRNIFSFLFVFLFIYVSDDTVFFGTNDNSKMIGLKYAFIVSIAIIMLLFSLIKHNKFFLSVEGYLLFMVVLLFTTMVFNNDFRFGYFYKIILLIYAYSIVRFFSLEEFAQNFNRVLSLISLFSIIGFVIMYISPSLMKVFPTITNTANTMFYNAGLFVTPVSFYSDYVRNYGIFREPGVFQIFLIVALVFQIFVIKKVSIFRYIMYIIAILTTMSTTGYIALAIILLLMVFNKDIVSNFAGRILLICLTVGLIGLSLFTSAFSLVAEDSATSVFAKLFDLNSKSTISRYASITENIRIVGLNPFAGVGLTNLAELFPEYSYMTYGYATVHNTNTILIQFASHGIIYGIMWCFAYWKFAKIISKKKAIWIAIVFLILYIGENLTYSGFSNLFLMYGLVGSNQKAVRVE